MSNLSKIITRINHKKYIRALNYVNNKYNRKEIQSKNRFKNLKKQSKNKEKQRI